jgi:hypothetical protein
MFREGCWSHNHSDYNIGNNLELHELHFSKKTIHKRKKYDNSKRKRWETFKKKEEKGNIKGECSKKKE